MTPSPECSHTVLEAQGSAIHNTVDGFKVDIHFLQNRDQTQTGAHIQVPRWLRETSRILNLEEAYLADGIDWNAAGHEVLSTQEVWDMLGIHGESLLQ